MSGLAAKTIHIITYMQSTSLFSSFHYAFNTQGKAFFLTTHVYFTHYEQEICSSFKKLLKSACVDTH